MQEEWKPKVGLVFDSQEDAWKFWVNYGGRIGFGVRKEYSHVRKDGLPGACRFVCCKEGTRKPDRRDYKTKNPTLETRTDCKSMLGLRSMSGKLAVHTFVEEHNHILHLQETTHMLSYLRKVPEVQCHEINLADDAGLKQKKSFDLMSKQVGGRANLGFTQLDQKNHLRKRRQRSLVHGEAGYLLQYFQRKLVENPTSYHAYQLDSEDQITNVFWADSSMLIDYEYFGDVISLDATYCTNRSHRPLAVFSGFNHHRRAVIFGAALLYDETTDSYKWLLETFLEAHKQKMPRTVFTDQNHALMKALAEVIPGAYHGLCTWHLMQNAMKHLDYLMNEKPNLLIDFKKCMYGYDDEKQFEDGWKVLLDKYDPNKKTWLQKVDKLKEKWASCYMKKAFTLGMRSTQLSESVNADIKSLTSWDLDIVKNFKRFEDVVEEKRYNELKCEYEAHQKIPRLKNQYSEILQQMSQLYTPTIFDLFQHEYELFEACSVKSVDKKSLSIDYVIVMVSDLGEWQVSVDLDNKLICCSCRKFETFGILCCHCLRVFIHIEMKSMPEQYILKRWTKLARGVTLEKVGVNHVVEDPHLSTSQCYPEICRRLIRIATEACRNKETITFLSKVTDELDKYMLEFQNKQVSTTQVSDCVSKVREIASNNNSATHVKGFKKKEGRKGSKCMKSWPECQLSKKNKKGSKFMKDNSSALQSQEPTMITQMQKDVPNTSTPIWLNDAYNQQFMGKNDILSQFGVTSFTSLLTEQFDDDMTTLTGP